MMHKVKRVFLFVLLFITSALVNNIVAQPLPVPIPCNGADKMTAQLDCFQYVYGLPPLEADISFYCTFGNPLTNVYVAPGIGPTPLNLTGMYPIPCTPFCVPGETTLGMVTIFGDPVGIGPPKNPLMPNGSMPVGPELFCPCFNAAALIEWTMVCTNRVPGVWLPIP